MSDIKNLLSTIDGLAKDDDNVVFLHDSVDLELSEDFVIETGVVGFTEDGIVLEADNETIEFLELHDIILEDGRDDYQQDGAGFVFDPTGEDNPIGDDFYTYTIDAGSGTYNNGTSGVTLTITSPEGEEKVVSDNFTYFDPELGGLGNPNMQAELASWFENGHGVGDEGMAEGKRYKYSEAEGDDCEKCNGTGKLDRHSEDPHKCNACDGKGKEKWKPEPTDFSKFNIGEAEESSDEVMVAKMLAKALGDPNRWTEMSAPELYAELESTNPDVADMIRNLAKMLYDVKLQERAYKDVGVADTVKDQRGKEFNFDKSSKKFKSQDGEEADVTTKLGKDLMRIRKNQMKRTSPSYPKNKR